MVWGWIIGMVFIQCVAMSMAELCSAMPTRYPPKNRQMGILLKLTSSTVADCIMQQLFLLPQNGDHSQRGSPDGRTGSVKSPERHQ